MPIIRKILTVHCPVAPTVADELLTSVEGALHRSGALRVWIDPASTYDLTVMAELPDPSGEADVPDPRAVDAGHRDPAPMV